VSALKIHKTYIHAEVNIMYETLPEAHGLPEQIDIKRIVLERRNKGRPVELLAMMDPGDVVALEDEILAARGEQDE